MSGLAGLLALGGGSAETLVLQRMLAALAHRGRDGQNTWSSGPIAMGHQAFWTTPEARGEIQDLKNTLPMVTVGTVAAIAVGVVTGVLSAWRRGSVPAV